MHAPRRRSEIEDRAAFDLIRYAQVWEDADVLVEALRPGAGDTVVSIASAGDNALALLAEGAERVIAVDLNPTQLACVRIRVSAYRTLSHAELLELMGSRPSARRGELLDRTARSLEAADQHFWAARREAVIAHGLGGVGKFESYFRLLRTGLLPFTHGRDTVRALLEPRSPAARAAFYDRRWNNLRWRTTMRLFFSRAAMGRLGRDPAFFDQVSGSVGDHVAGKTRQALVEQDPSKNPYLAWILTGRHGATLPRALREETFEAVRNRLERLELAQCSVEALAERGLKADAFNLSDIFEYMSPPAHAEAYDAVLALARPGARIAYWNMMAPRRAPAALADRVRTRTDLEARLRPQDKAFFYSDFVVEEVA
jgi:S-adenosylmethionine-diacylglycerol 3-amino-3-carboxypropyl transferase